MTHKEELEQKAKEAVELVYERVDRNADLDEHERLIIEQIQLLQQDYKKAVQPWLQRLASLRALRAPQTMVIDGEFVTFLQGKWSSEPIPELKEQQT